MTTNAPLKTELKFSLTDSKPEKKLSRKEVIKIALKKTNAKESFKKVGSKN
ncbi:hypothetical protein HMPREF1398_00890 [Helicobacter pylori GAM117Ai]|nr:hypothetical protein HMPREF1398_00890 [Helicobacter pylori GAM117Ai]